MEHLNCELEHVSRVKHSHFLLEHALIDRLQVKQVVDEAKHQNDLELNELQEVLDLLLVFRAEAETCDELEILLDGAEGSSHLM